MCSQANRKAEDIENIYTKYFYFKNKPLEANYLAHKLLKLCKIVVD
jgi:hypothetical protein